MMKIGPAYVFILKIKLKVLENKAETFLYFELKCAYINLRITKKLSKN